MANTLKSTASTFLTLRPTSALYPKPAACSLVTQSHSNTPSIQYPNRSRTFVNNPLTPLQKLTASSILPYYASDIYALIADISSYPSFVPYCTSSTITSESGPDKRYSKRWPRAADLRVGWESFNEVFRSRVYCHPDHVLEAVAGDAESTISKDLIPHYYNDDASSQDSADSGVEDATSKIFASLLTRWTLREFPFKAPPTDRKRLQDAGHEEASGPRTEVNLVIEVRFASAMYAALSQAAAPKVAGIMVGAFERRAREVLGEGHAVGQKEKEGLERAGKGGQSALEGVT